MRGDNAVVPAPDLDPADGAASPDLDRIDSVVRLGVADAGELLTLQRAAYVTEAQLHEDLRLPPLVQTLDQLRTELAAPNVAAWGVRRASDRLAA